MIPVKLHLWPLILFPVSWCIDHEHALHKSYFGWKCEQRLVMESSTHRRGTNRILHFLKEPLKVVVFRTRFWRKQKKHKLDISCCNAVHVIPMSIKQAFFPFVFVPRARHISSNFVAYVGDILNSEYPFPSLMHPSHLLILFTLLNYDALANTHACK